METKIVVATTQPSLAKNLKKKLKDVEELEVISSNDGFDAIKRVRKEKPKVALIEDILPQVGGFKFSRLIKFDKKFYHTVIFILSEDSGEENVALAKEVGADGILAFNEDQIKEAIKNYL